MNYQVRILAKNPLTHDVIQFRLERPAGYQFSAGQATELTITEPVARGPAPFTFTGLNTRSDLELTIKIYKERKGLTSFLANLNIGDTVVITDAWDSFINNGPGVFIAGGAGITPFIALLGQMKADGNVGGSQLFFSNKTRQDIFLQDELKSILGNRYVDIITRDEKVPRQRIDEAFIRKSVMDLRQPFYVCGPPGFVELVQDVLRKVGASEQMINISL